MLRSLSSARRRVALLTLLVVASAAVASVWLVATREPADVAAPPVSTHERLRARAAAAEALVVLASLRASFDGNAAPVPHGSHARHATRQLDALLVATGTWPELDDDVAALRSLILAADPAALERAVALERDLRAELP